MPQAAKQVALPVRASGWHDACQIFSMWETPDGISGAWRALALALGATPAAAQKAWRHAIIEAKSDAGFAMMVTRGFAEKQGLKLEIMQIKADQIGLKALLAGELDSYEGGPGGAIVAAARGADVKILGCHWPGLVHGLFARERRARSKTCAARISRSRRPARCPIC